MATGRPEITRQKYQLGPEQWRYPPDEVPLELMAEGLRAYMTNPNYFKSTAPKTAAAIRKSVNSNPELSKVVQFNVGGVPAGVLGMAGNQINALSDQSGQYGGQGTPTNALMPAGYGQQPQGDPGVGYGDENYAQWLAEISNHPRHPAYGYGMQRRAGEIGGAIGRGMVGMGTAGVGYGLASGDLPLAAISGLGAGLGGIWSQHGDAYAERNGADQQRLQQAPFGGPGDNARAAQDYSMDPGSSGYFMMPRR